MRSGIFFRVWMLVATLGISSPQGSLVADDRLSDCGFLPPFTRVVTVEENLPLDAYWTVALDNDRVISFDGTIDLKTGRVAHRSGADPYATPDGKYITLPRRRLTFYKSEDYAKSWEEKPEIEPVFFDAGLNQDYQSVGVVSQSKETTIYRAIDRSLRMQDYEDKDGKITLRGELKSICAGVEELRNLIHSSTPILSKRGDRIAIEVIENGKSEVDAEMRIYDLDRATGACDPKPTHILGRGISKVQFDYQSRRIAYERPATGSELSSPFHDTVPLRLIPVVMDLETGESFPIRFPGRNIIRFQSPTFLPNGHLVLGAVRKEPSSSSNRLEYWIIDTDRYIAWVRSAQKGPPSDIAPAMGCSPTDSTEQMLSQLIQAMCMTTVSPLQSVHLVRRSLDLSDCKKLVAGLLNRLPDNAASRSSRQAYGQLCEKVFNAPKTPTLAQNQSVLSPPAAMKTCKNCHGVNSQYFIPFDDPKKMRKLKPRAKGSQMEDLWSESLRRLTPEEVGAMPPSEVGMGEDQKLEIFRYLGRFHRAK